MNIYIITRTNPGYDEYDGHCIVAKDEEEAKSLIVFADEGKEGWDNCSVKLIGTANKDIEEGIKLSSFNAG